MNRRKLPHVVAVGVLAALLALPGPALAQGGHSRVSAGVLEWLAGLWGRAMAIQDASLRPTQKEGYGIDPNGGRSAAAGGSTGQSATGSGTATGSVIHDEGYGIDPNG